MAKRKKLKNSNHTANKESLIETLENLEQENKQKRFVPATALDKIKLSEKQQELVEMLDKNDIVIVTGPAGTSKTFIDSYYAVRALRDHQFEKVIFTKPIHEAGERLGFLPGQVQEKIDPHYESFKISILKMIKASNFEKLLEKNTIEFRPLAYMRGATFDDTLMIIDEAQNSDIRQIMLFVTRMGMNSKVIISGDIHQYDINKNHIGLPFFVEHIAKDIDGVGIFNFSKDDIVRNPILIEITDKYEKLKAHDMLPRNKY